MTDKPGYDVGVYEDHHWVTTVTFRQKWQALLFHTLLHKSTRHLGTQEGSHNFEQREHQSR